MPVKLFLSFRPVDIRSRGVPAFIQPLSLSSLRSSSSYPIPSTPLLLSLVAHHRPILRKILSDMFLDANAPAFSVPATTTHGEHRVPNTRLAPGAIPRAEPRLERTWMALCPRGDPWLWDWGLEDEVVESGWRCEIQ